MSDYTRRFDLPADDTVDTREILSQVYNSLQQKGYNPINQIVGYILSEDPRIRRRSAYRRAAGHSR